MDRPKVWEYSYKESDLEDGQFSGDRSGEKKEEYYGWVGINEKAKLMEPNAAPVSGLGLHQAEAGDSADMQVEVC